MFRNIIKLLVAFLIISLSGLLFFGSLGYYILWFDWGGGATNKITHAIIFILLIIASVVIYSFGEKLRSRN